MNKFLLLVVSYFQYVIARAAKPVPVYVALYQNNIELLQNRLKDISNPISPNYRQWLTSEEINKHINPSQEHQNSVINWIQNYNITDLTNYGDNIKFSATPSVLKEIFSLNGDNPEKLVGYKIPPQYKQIIQFVEMSSKPLFRNDKINITSPSNITDDRWFAREPLRRLYNVSNISLDGQVSGGLIEYQSNQGFTNSDLNKQQSDNGQRLNNVANYVGENTGTDPESELDVQLISQAADGINLWFWDTPYWLYSLAVDFYNREDVPDVISMSWGWAQDSQCDIIDCQNITSQQYVNRVNNEYLKIALRGTTIVVSSGDAGAPGRTNENCSPERAVNPVFPGSSPYVVSSGATFVQQDSTQDVNYSTAICQNNSCITSLNEKAISFEHVGWTAGGGFSHYETETPDWQYNAVTQFLNTTKSLPNSSSFNRNGRAYPDLSAIGHSCPTYMDGYLSAVDGTSCSSPIIAGLLSIINYHEWKNNRTRLGFVNPLLYYLADNCQDCFNDIKDGHNWCTEGNCCDNPTQFGYQATEGYDTVTGLGTLNVGNIVDFLDNFYNHKR